MEEQLVVPAKGVIVRDPYTAQIIPETGAVKKIGKYWKRRERDGSVKLLPVPVVSKKSSRKEE